MAGTDDDDSTSEWRLLRDEHAFIVALPLVKSLELADTLIRQFLQGGAVDRDGRERYRFRRVEAWPGGQVNPYDGSFWRSDPEFGIRCEISCPTSSALWTGPTSIKRRAITGRQTAEYQIALIWLCHDAVLEFLQDLELLPAAEPTEPVSEPAIEPAPVTEPIAGNPSVREPIPLDVWLRTVKREHPQWSDETNKGWAARLIKIMEMDKSEGLIDRIWSQENMERRLRDKSGDDDGSYQGGN